MKAQANILFWLKAYCCFFFISLPFSYSLFPNVGHAIAPFFEKVATVWGKGLFGIADPVHLGSDSSGLYLHLITVGLLSTGLWWAWKGLRKQGVVSGSVAWGARIELFVDGVVIFFLVLHLFKYGFDKLFKHQFYYPEPNTQFTPLGYLTKDILYWSAVGSSYSYNLVLGIVELVPAALLLFRRTRLLGGLIAAAVLLHVVLLNAAFDISVKVHGSMLLLAAITIIAPAVPALIRHLTRSGPAGTPKWKFKPVWISLTLLFVLLTESLLPYLQSGSFHGDKAQKPWLHGAYSVVTHAETPTAWKRFFVHSKFYFIVQDQHDGFQDYAFRWGWQGDDLVMDLGEKGLLFPQWEEADSTLRLHGMFEGDSLQLSGKMIDMSLLPLADDGFGWTVPDP